MSVCRSLFPVKGLNTNTPGGTLELPSTVQGPDRDDIESRLSSKVCWSRAKVKEPLKGRVYPLTMLNLATHTVLDQLTQLELPQMETVDAGDEVNFAVETVLSLIFFKENQDLVPGLVQQILINTGEELDAEQKQKFCFSLLLKLKGLMDKTDKSLITKAAYCGKVTTQDWYKIFYDFYVFSESINSQVGESIRNMLKALCVLDNNPSSLEKTILQYTKELRSRIRT